MTDLLIMRHAKAAVQADLQHDFDRPLTEFGRESCETTAKILKSLGLHVDAVITSSAVRTRETAELVVQGFVPQPEVRQFDVLYNAGTAQIERMIQDVLLDDPSCLLVVGHNPGIAGVMCRRAGCSLAVPPATLAIFRGQSATDLMHESGRHATFTGLIQDGRFLRHEATSPGD